MTPERWQDVARVLNSALELAPEERPAYLDRACASDPSLRQEVESLLASEDNIRSSFLQSPPLAAQSPVPVDDRQIQVTISLGAAMVAPGDSPDSLLKRAGRQLYASKQSGRNRVSL